METLILAFVITLLAIAGLAIGVLAGRPPIKGSCGGIACAKGISCSVCPSRAKAEAER